MNQTLTELNIQTHIVYLGLGSNMGDSIGTIKQALVAISCLTHVALIQCSQLYQTTPVSPIPQKDYVNAACVLKTTLSLEHFAHSLSQIEKELGKQPKSKMAPRPIDIDILFFGHTFYRTDTLQVPHLRWKERLFVLMPLQDLTPSISYPINAQGDLETLNVKDFLISFPNFNKEHVFPLNKNL